MRLADIKALEPHLRVLEGHKRLEVDEIIGLAVQVAFANGRDATLQMFIPYQDPEYAAIMNILEPKIKDTKANAEGKLAELSTKIADAVRKTPTLET